VAPFPPGQPPTVKHEPIPKLNPRLTGPLPIVFVIVLGFGMVICWWGYDERGQSDFHRRGLLSGFRNEVNHATALPGGTRKPLDGDVFWTRLVPMNCTLSIEKPFDAPRSLWWVGWGLVPE